MKKNEKLRDEVLAAIKVEPLLIAVKIAVAADGGIITLSGTVDSYVKKRAAEHVTNKVPGVLAVIEKIQVKFGCDNAKNDEAPALEILEHPRRL